MDELVLIFKPKGHSYPGSIFIFDRHLIDDGKKVFSFLNRSGNWWNFLRCGLLNGFLFGSDLLFGPFYLWFWFCFIRFYLFLRRFFQFCDHFLRFYPHGLNGSLVSSFPELRRHRGPGDHRGHRRFLEFFLFLRFR